SPAPYVIAGYATIALAFGVFGTWAATAPLASGTVAGGTVAVFSNRKVVQHLEGGIVSEILVKEGNVVEMGDVLVRLDSTQAQGNHAVLKSRLAFMRATEARLEAESIDADEINFPQDILEADGADACEPIFVKLQRTLFNDRKATKAGQIGILRVRIEQPGEELIGLESQRNHLSEPV